MRTRNLPAEDRERINAQNRARYHANKTRYRKNQRRYELSLKARAHAGDRVLQSKALVKAARQRARKLGLAFEITFEDVPVPERCPVLGMPLNRGRGIPQFDSPSLDRIRPFAGYVLGNVIVVSNKANMIKNCANPAELRLVADFYQGLD